MRRTMLVVGMLVAGGLATQAQASSPGNPMVTPTAAPIGADFIVPPHLAGGLPGPPGWAPDLRGLPTLRDLVAASPTYTAPPPKRRRVRQP